MCIPTQIHDWCLATSIFIAGKSKIDVIKDIIFQVFFLYSVISLFSPNKHKLKPTVHIYKSLQILQNHCPDITGFTPLGIPAHEKQYHNGHLSQPKPKSLYMGRSLGSVFCNFYINKLVSEQIFLFLKVVFVILRFRIDFLYRSFVYRHACG